MLIFYNASLAISMVMFLVSKSLMQKALFALCFLLFSGAFVLGQNDLIMMSHLTQAFTTLSKR